MALPSKLLNPAASIFKLGFGALAVTALGAQSADAGTLIMGLPDGTADAYYQLFDPTVATGSGTFNTFLQLDAGGNATVEEGYSTNERPLLSDNPDASNSPQQTEVLPLDGFLTTIGSDTYVAVGLDINEGGDGNTLQLDELQLFISMDSDLTDYDSAGNGSIGGQTSFFDLMNAPITLTQSPSGSGRADYFFLFETGGLDPSILQDPASYNLYLYSQLSDIGTGGFEEFGQFGGDFSVVPPTPVPTPALLPGLIGFGMSIVRKRKQQQASDLATA